MDPTEENMYVLDHADRTAPTRQHELLVDHTDLPEISTAVEHQAGVDDLIIQIFLKYLP